MKTRNQLERLKGQVVELSNSDGSRCRARVDSFWRPSQPGNLKGYLMAYVYMENRDGGFEEMRSLVMAGRIVAE